MAGARLYPSGCAVNFRCSWHSPCRPMRAPRVRCCSVSAASPAPCAGRLAPGLGRYLVQLTTGRWGRRRDRVARALVHGVTCQVSRTRLLRRLVGGALFVVHATRSRLVEHPASVRGIARVALALRCFASRSAHRGVAGAACPAAARKW